jgi:hypothetical protein
MQQFPRTQIEGLSVSRLMIGTNWFLGYSHTSAAKDQHILDTVSEAEIADILTVFMRAGVDTLYGVHPVPKLVNGIREAEQRTGRRCLTVSIPSFPLQDRPETWDEVRRQLDALVELGVDICMPHQCTTDAFVDRRHGTIPGLSTHMPETPVYADATGLDVGTYIQIYNAAGFLMQIEIDWVQRMIWNAKKPVITIKPLGAGRLPPLVGLAFAWSTLRDCDAVCIGTQTALEAAEVIEISQAILEHRLPDLDLQTTRSKASLSTAARQ